MGNMHANFFDEEEEDEEEAPYAIAIGVEGQGRRNLQTKACPVLLTSFGRVCALQKPSAPEDACVRKICDNLEVVRGQPQYATVQSSS